MNKTEFQQYRFSPDEEKLVAQAQECAAILYEGKNIPHRSCGISLALTFKRSTSAYQSLRRGGITGKGNCGSIVAGHLILGEILGDPDPQGAVRDELRQAIELYDELWQERFNKDFSNIACNDLLKDFKEFHSDERNHFCTNLASTVAELVARILLVMGADFEVDQIVRFLAP